VAEKAPGGNVATKADKVKDVVKDVPPAGQGPLEDPTEIRQMPDIIPTPGIGNFGLH
jgi:hypothetical protein